MTSDRTLSDRLTHLAKQRAGESYHRLDAATVDRYLATIARLPTRPASVLDIGCGTGVLADAITALGYAAQGIDLNAEYMSKMDAPHAVGSIAAIPLADRAVDVVIAGEILEHLPVDVFERAPLELARVARRRIIVTVPNREALEAASTRCPACGCTYSAVGHVRRFERGDMPGLIPGFTLAHLTTVGPYKLRHRSIEWVVRRRLLGRWPAAPGRQCPQCGIRQPGTPGPSRPPSLPGRALRFLAAAPWQRWWLLAQYDRSDGETGRSVTAGKSGRC